MSKRTASFLVIWTLLTSTMIGAAASAEAKQSEPAVSAQTPSAAQAAPAVVPAEPQQTMSTFGDWVVRCERMPEPTSQSDAKRQAPKRVCEAAQALVIKGQQAPVAQIAFGYPVADNATAKDTGKPGEGSPTLTVLLPNNVSFDKPPRIAASETASEATLTYRRCLPAGCIADAKPTAALVKDLRTTGKPGHLSFTDAGERTLTLPMSTRGLAQALDNLAREANKDASDNV